MATIEVLDGPERRRRWSVEQKQRIVSAAFGPV
jgi:transposase-like protein